MKAVQTIQGTAVPLDLSDVDTDQIIPSDWCKRVDRAGLGAGLFAEWREDVDFVLNQPQYAGSSILVAGPNFGTGSSREHAVWAIEDYGFHAVVSPRFGDIFSSNCTKVGVIPVVVEGDVGEALLRAVQADPRLQLTIDVRHLRLLAPEVSIDVPFPMDSAIQYRILNGLDDIGLTLAHDDDIGAFEATRPQWLTLMS